MGPARLGEHLAIKNVGVARVKQRYRICVLRIWRGWIDVTEGILGLGLGALLGEVEGLVVLDFLR
jgi:hypothetical protein